MEKKFRLTTAIEEFSKEFECPKNAISCHVWVDVRNGEDYILNIILQHPTRHAIHTRHFNIKTKSYQVTAFSEMPVLETSESNVWYDKIGKHVRMPDGHIESSLWGVRDLEVTGDFQLAAHSYQM